MKTVKDVLDSKGREVWSICPKKSVFDGVAIMAEKNIGVLAVIDNDQMVGIISERDCSRKIILNDYNAREMKVQDIMTSKVVYVTPERTVEECLALMANKKFRHLPVLVNGKLDGLISAVDLTRALLADQEFIIEQLEQYIGG